MHVSEDTPDLEIYWDSNRTELLSLNPQECVGSRVEDKCVNITVAHFRRGGETNP